MSQEKVCEQLACQIVENTREMTGIWDELDYYAQHKALPSKSQIATVGRRVDEMGRAEIIDLCWNVYPSIVKFRRRLKTEKNPMVKAELSAALKAKESELEQLKNMRDNGVV